MFYALMATAKLPENEVLVTPTIPIDLVSNEDYARDFTLRAGTPEQFEDIDITGALVKMTFVNSKTNAIIIELRSDSVTPFGSTIEVFPDGSRFGVRIIPFGRKYTRADRPERRTVTYDCTITLNGATKRLFSGRVNYKWGTTSDEEALP